MYAWRSLRHVSSTLMISMSVEDECLKKFYGGLCLCVCVWVGKKVTPFVSIRVTIMDVL